MLCEALTNHPNVDIINELYALQCPYAPWLLTFTGTNVPEGLHKEAVVCGYYFFILMNRPSGQILDLIDTASFPRSRETRSGPHRDKRLSKFNSII